MTHLAAAIGALPTQELRATRILLHMTGDRARLGWPAGMEAGQVRVLLLGHYPTLYAELCRLISAELIRRDLRFGACYVCELGTEPVPAPGPPA
jgi:hypothetical protein